MGGAMIRAKKSQKLKIDIPLTVKYGRITTKVTTTSAKVAADIVSQKYPIGTSNKELTLI